MIPLYNRLQTAWRKNFRSTKPAVDRAESGEELEQAQSKTLDYNRNYRLSDSRRHCVREFLLRILAPPLAPLHNGLKIICRKILWSIKRAGRFGGTCWWYAKKGLLHVLAPLRPFSRPLKTILRKNLQSIKRAGHLVAGCWHYGKKGGLRALTPLAPIYHRLKIIWRKNLRL